MAKPVLTIENNLSGSFHIWADGSFQDKSPYLGTGYLIYDDEGHELLQKGRSFPRGDHASSTIAELLSCTAALRGTAGWMLCYAAQRLRICCQHLQKNLFAHDKKPLDQALKALFNEVARHDSVKAVLTHEGASHYLKQAHNLSVTARRYKM